MTRYVCLLALLLALPLAACGAEPAPAPQPPSGASANEGRSLGGGSPPSDARLTAARTFVRDYVRWRAGTVRASRVRAASPSLRRALAGSRITPAQQERRTVVRDVELIEEAPEQSRALATLRNVDEGLDYGLPLELELRGDGWLVVRIPADD